MPPKAKVGHKATNPAPIAAESQAPREPETIDERSHLRFLQSNTLEQRRREAGLSGLTPAEYKNYTYTRLIGPVAQRQVSLSAKSEREFWKHVVREGLPVQRLRDDYTWGTDRNGQNVGSYTLQDFDERCDQQTRLAALDILHRCFLSSRERTIAQGGDVEAQVIEEEKARRKEMASLRHDLYGEYSESLAAEPEWDDVMPVPLEEPDDALARIAYPEEYEEALSYLRACMAAQECSPRCLRLTEHVISMNPAHYTVWLYRFKIISTLNLSVAEEIEWLNQVALDNLKNYQIWHHRQLLLDFYYPTIAADADAVKQLAKSETDFIATILEEDTKNYHVWSYRQYLVDKLGLWTASELEWTETMIDNDVRNNSAWSHRFFLVFSDPSVASEPKPQPMSHDDKIPQAIINRELAFAQAKIALAPQNQSGWNYLRGVLTKGGRTFDQEKAFAAQYVIKLGQEEEVVHSSHALDLLAEAYAAQGEKEEAKLCLQRLCDKWDPVREGYWKFRMEELDRDSTPTID
ncbi:hypothetical protein CDD82_5013 [Ophiocordyceps australis]|uniref:Protein farnesyltransferase/geranylgeranyltransferase type-1 subunit alpha n=1 Tax=Ophiocordyceps australis TaxID=1399860 RepID=A0A2C5Z3C8_9HYPO|nr:hypothetical protein CDD82_5013 [Ophiocordyceps australis]